MTMVDGAREPAERLSAMADHEVTRRNILKMGGVGVGAAGLASFLAACKTDDDDTLSSSGGKPKPGGTVVIARAQDSVNMDKTMVFSNASIWVFVQIYETLVMGGKDGTTVEPGLAQSWSQSSDKLSWTFELRPNVRFSDGTPVTSADVKFSIDEAGSAKGGWEFINAAIDTVTAPDPTTVVVRTKYPWAPLLADLACPSNGIIPDNYGGRTKDAFYAAPIGTGPFMWDTWDKGNKLTLKKNPGYWRDGLPYLDSVSWQVVPDSNTRGIMIQGGTAQINENPPLSTVEQLKGVKGVTVTLFPSTRTDYVSMNEARKPYDDEHVRRAISYAIDRAALTKNVLFGNGTIANSLLMPSTPYYDKNTPGLQYDMDKAKAELARSSVPNGFSTTYMATSGDATDAAIAQILQASLKELGITMKISNTDPSAAHDLLAAQNYDIAHVYWTMDIADPDELVQFAVLPSGGGHAFYTGYDDASAQRLAEQAQKTFDPSERQRLYSELQARLADAAFVAPLFYQPLPYATRDNVAGFFVKPTGVYDMAVVGLT
jgi:peptide/nickel transport system substrate-binding protein